MRSRSINSARKMAESRKQIKQRQLVLVLESKIDELTSSLAGRLAKVRSVYAETDVFPRKFPRVWLKKAQVNYIKSTMSGSMHSMVKALRLVQNKSYLDMVQEVLEHNEKMYQEEKAYIGSLTYDEYEILYPTCPVCGSNDGCSYFPGTRKKY